MLMYTEQSSIYIQQILPAPSHPQPRKCVTAGPARLPHAAGRIWGHPGASSRRSWQNKLVKSVKSAFKGKHTLFLHPRAHPLADSCYCRV